MIAGRKAAMWLRRQTSILVSHGPRMTMYGSLALASQFKRRRHLAYSFNFTELPQGVTRKLMTAVFKSVDRFVCFSNRERKLYAEHFNLDIDRIDMMHWAARPPSFDASARRAVAGDYVCAIGSQGRDYAVLLAAMKTLPSIKLVLVATPASLAGLDIPRNVEVHCNIALEKAMNILQGSRFAVVPLRGSAVPCGHVTIVAAMHCKKAVIVSDSSGIADYVVDGVNGVTVPTNDPKAMATNIERLWSDPALSSRLGCAAQAFAQMRCSEQAAVDYFQQYLQSSKGSRYMATSTVRGLEFKLVAPVSRSRWPRVQHRTEPRSWHRFVRCHRC